MKDQFGRKIDYLRVSITDRCNLRCRYCQPRGVKCVSHEDVLRYEEIIRVCWQAVKLGITKFKVTGGEPLARKGCVNFVRSLKALSGVEQVTLTTNGLLLLPVLDELLAAGLDGINISIDTLDDALYSRLTGAQDNSVQKLIATLDACLQRGVRTKVNVVLLRENFSSLGELASLAQRNIDVRFIEVMPIGAANSFEVVSSDVALEHLRSLWPDLHSVSERRGNGPARYFASKDLRGRLGFIDAVSRKFCESCNRARLTSTGLLKPCLCYGVASDLRKILRGRGSDDKLCEEIARAIFAKSLAHCFEYSRADELKIMSQIGG